jgi:hypothetical protein
MNKRKALYAVSVALLLTLTLGGILQAQGNRSLFSWVIADRLTVANNAEVGGDASVSDDLSVSDDMSVGGFEVVIPQTSLLLTMNGWLTPTGTIQPIRAAGAVSINSTRIAPGSSGQRLTLINYGANTVTITETAPHLMAGNFAIGAGDTLTMVYSGTAWVEVARVNN